jgi:glycosyltransferase involved in cell wall biosynthesis
MKPKILLMPDVPGWAFDFCAREIMHHLGDKYDFELRYINAKTNGKKLIAPKAGEFDLVFRFIYYVVGATKHIPKKELLTSIRGEASVRNAPKHFTEAVMTTTYNSISVVAWRLADLMPKKCCPIFYTPNGVDTDLFRPAGDARRDEFTIGFAGNSRHPAANKGVRQIVQAASAAGVELIAADRKIRWIPHYEMPAFYNRIDAYVCFSKSEGSPNTIREASACGRPVITTDVGDAADVVLHGKTGLIIDRNVDALIEAINTLKNDLDLCRAMGAAAREHMVAGYDWREAVKNYDKWFTFALNNKGD